MANRSNSKTDPESVRILCTRLCPNDAEPQWQDTEYMASQSGLIENGIVPPDFFNFKGPLRHCSRGRYGKKITSKYSFPDGVLHIMVQRKAGQWIADVRHELNKPPYIPPGETMPTPTPNLYARPDNPLGIDGDDHGHSGHLIGAGAWQRRNGFSVSFSGSKQQLIASGLATAAMFPEGKTVGGKERTEKRSPRNAEASWFVTMREDLGGWQVYFYDFITLENIMLDALKEYQRTTAAGVLHELGRRLRDQADDQDA